MSPELSSISLDLEIEDLEARPDRCCGGSTTNTLCTCPIRLTDCCDGFEYANQS